MEHIENLYDLIVIGGGPAGLSAAIYMARAQYRTLVIEREETGGQISITAEVVNYPGVLHTDGAALVETMRQQAERFGAEFLSATVQSLSMDSLVKEVKTDQGTFRALGLVLATGAAPRPAGFQGEQEYRGRGVAYCATCDGEFFTGKDIFVIGGGFAAAEEALFLTKYAKQVTICVRSDAFTCAKTIADQVLAHPKIRVLFHTQITEAGGDSMLRYAVLKNNQTGETTRYEAENGDTFGIFVFAGYQPETSLFADRLALTEGGYLQTDQNQKTSCDGVYGAGDVCEKSLRQVVTAVSDGAIAAVSLEKYVARQHALHQIPPCPMKKKTSSAKSVEPVQKQTDASDELFTPEIREQLETVFKNLQNDFLLRVYADGSALSQEMMDFTSSLCELSEHLRWKQIPREKNPAISLCDESGNPLGFSFHGVPGGHELNSFVVTLCHAAGLGQPLDADLKKRIQAHSGCHIEIAVTLSCTMCPETVMAAGRLALLHPKIQTDIYDVSHYPEMREKYQIMSVPCILVNGQVASFGKKNLEALLTLIS